MVAVWRACDGHGTATICDGSRAAADHLRRLTGSVRRGRARRRRRRSGPGSCGPSRGGRPAARRPRRRRPRGPAPRPGRAGSPGPGTARRPRCGGGPRSRNARTASPVAGGEAEANAAVTGSLWCEPQSRASRATAWLASGSLEPAAASTSASSSRTRAVAQRLAHPHVEHLEEARLEAEDARSPGSAGPRGARWPRRPRSGTSTFAWNASVSSRGTTTISSWPALHQPVDDRLRTTAWTARGTPPRCAGRGASRGPRRRGR